MGCLTVTRVRCHRLDESEHVFPPGLLDPLSVRNVHCLLGWPARVHSRAAPGLAVARLEEVKRERVKAFSLLLIKKKTVF